MELKLDEKIALKMCNAIGSNHLLKEKLKQKVKKEAVLMWTLYFYT